MAVIHTKKMIFRSFQLIVDMVNYCSVANGAGNADEQYNSEIKMIMP
jgi:hypothetical protein